jgi:hypothetical protein
VVNSIHCCIFQICHQLAIIVFQNFFFCYFFFNLPGSLRNGTIKGAML